MTIKAVSGGEVRPLMRFMLLIGAAFVLGAGVQLYVLAEDADRYFAWSIANPLTAATLGAFYLAAAPMALAAAREASWAQARVGILPITIFVWLTLATSVAHHAEFRFDASGLPMVAAVAWFVIYVADPPLLTLALARQMRRGSTPQPRTAPMPVWVAVALVSAAIPITSYGVALYARPTLVGDGWAWPLPPIAAQTFAAWLIALGLLFGSMAREGDWVRCRTVGVGLTALGALQLAALAWYRDIPQEPITVGWIAVASLSMVLGLVVLSQGRRLSPETHSRAESTG